MVGMIISAVGGLVSAGIGAWRQSQAAKKQEALMASQKAAQEVWYNRNYYQDYLNTVGAQNAIKKMRDEYAQRTREARARQAITGGTPEQAQAVAETNAKAMGNVIGDLAAKGEQNRQAMDAQKPAMDANLNQQEQAIAAQRQQAGANLINNGIGVATSALQGMELPGTKSAGATVAATDAAPGMEAAVAAGRETRINPTSYSAPIVTPQYEPTQAEKNERGLKARGY